MAEIRAISSRQILFSHYFVVTTLWSASIVKAAVLYCCYCCTIAAVSNEDREVVYLFQRLSICVQRFNAVYFTTASLKVTHRTSGHSSSF